MLYSRYWSAPLIDVAKMMALPYGREVADYIDWVGSCFESLQSTAYTNRRTCASTL